MNTAIHIFTAFWVRFVVLLESLQPAAQLAARLYVAKVFFFSGLTKLRDWEITVALFTDEYQVPLLSPELAALLGTAGELVLPSATVREPFVDTRDVADMAVAALTQEGHSGKTYELTGPRLMTFREAVAEFAAAGGADVVYTPVTVEAYAVMLREAGMPEDVIWLVTYLFGSVLDGRNERLSDDIARVLGRPPRDFNDFARDIAETGFWRT